MTGITILGLTAAALSVISFMPQLHKTYKTKHVRDLSLPMWLVFAVGAMLWIGYGVLAPDLPILLTNVIVLIMQLSVILMILRYRDK